MEAAPMQDGMIAPLFGITCLACNGQASFRTHLTSEREGVRIECATCNAQQALPSGSKVFTSRTGRVMTAIVHLPSGESEDG